MGVAPDDRAAPDDVFEFADAAAELVVEPSLLNEQPALTVERGQRP